MAANGVPFRCERNKCGDCAGSKQLNRRWRLLSSTLGLAMSLTELYQRFAITLVALVLMASTVSYAQEPKRTFDEGIYRQDGSCQKLTRFAKDETDKCGPYIGVLVRHQDRPEFMFPLSTGNSRVFVATEGAEFSLGNQVISYKVSRVVDMSTGMDYDVFGECILRLYSRHEEIQCTSWKESDRTELMFEAHFDGNGMWIHKPSFSKKR